MTRTRLTAAERSEQLVEAAITAFARGGYAGTTTDDVARLAGVSQPYVIRLFGTKQQLFITVVGHVSDRIKQRFREAAAVQPDLESLGDSFDRLLGERELLAVLLHGFAASAEPEIGVVARRCFGEIYLLVRELSGASAEEARGFIATGMLLTVLASMRVVGTDPVAQDPWMVDLLDTLENHQP